MENPFKNHDYPTETLVDAVNSLLERIDQGAFGPTCCVYGTTESVYLKAVRQAVERENYTRKLRHDALNERLAKYAADIAKQSDDAANAANLDTVEVNL